MKRLRSLKSSTLERLTFLGIALFFIVLGLILFYISYVAAAWFCVLVAGFWLLTGKVKFRDREE